MTLNEMQYNRLRWRCRRGMLELDLLLSPFFETMFHKLSLNQQMVFVRLLEQEDPELLDWFSHNSMPEDPELAELVEQILAQVRHAH